MFSCLEIKANMMRQLRNLICWKRTQMSESLWQRKSRFGFHKLSGSFVKFCAKNKNLIDFSNCCSSRMVKYYILSQSTNEKHFQRHYERVNIVKTYVSGAGFTLPLSFIHALLKSKFYCSVLLPNRTLFHAKQKHKWHNDMKSELFYLCSRAFKTKKVILMRMSRERRG